MSDWTATDAGKHPKALLAEYGLHPKKSLGQNFLFSVDVLSRIADAAGIESGDGVLEIGPGVGALTHVLAQRAGRVTAVELDGRFLPILRAELSHYTNVQLLHGDILEQNLDALFADTPYKVVANVPYYITGAILRHLLACQNKPTCVVLTVQKEVAQRVSAEPGRMSLLAVSVQYYGEAQVVGVIKAGAFWPRPDVDSAIVRIALRRELPLPMAEEKAFFRLVKIGFSQKRKQLQKNLRAICADRAQLQAAFAASGVDGRRRAETLSIEEWLALYHALFSPT